MAAPQVSVKGLAGCPLPSQFYKNCALITDCPQGIDRLSVSWIETDSRERRTCAVVAHVRPIRKLREPLTIQSKQIHNYFRDTHEADLVTRRRRHPSVRRAYLPR